jgi:hypothetical protein
MKSNLRRAGFAYTKREHDLNQENIFNFPFLLVTSSAPSCLAVGIESTDRSTEQSEASVFNISPVSTSDMAANVEIVVKLSSERGKPVLKVSREIGGTPSGKTDTFQPLGNTELGCASEGAKAPWSIFPRAFAQSRPSETQYIQKLQSDDVFTRRDARISLSKEDQNFNLIGTLLARDDDYRIQLGALAALAAMPEEQRKKAPTSVLDKVRSLRASKDKTMRDTAVQVLNEPALCYQEQDTNRQPAGRFLVMCYWTKEQCERTRGPNTKPGITQSPCAAVLLSRAPWNYAPGGYDGGWFQYSPTAFGPPFPPIQAQ